MGLRIDLTLVDQLDMVLFEVEEQVVDVELIRDLGTKSHLGVTFPGAKKGSLVRVPRYLANWLVSTHQARWLDTDLHSQLFNHLRQVQQSLRLEPLPTPLLSITIGRMGKGSSPGSASELEDPLVARKLEETLQNLVNERLKKVLRELRVVDFRKVEQSLDPLEKPVFEAVAELLATFHSYVSERGR